MKEYIFYTFKCPQKHAEGEECNGLIMLKMNETNQSYLPLFDTEILAQLAVDDLGFSVKPTVMKIKITTNL